jgi:hypothetical protein
LFIEPKLHPDSILVRSEPITAHTYITGRLYTGGYQPKEEEIFYELLRNGGSSAGAIAFQIVFGGDLDLVPIESMVLVEAHIFRGDDRVLEIGRDLIDRNGFVAVVIGRVVNPGLQSALDVHRGGRWINPPKGQKAHHGKRKTSATPKDKPQNKGSEKAPPKRGLVRCDWAFGHISE